MFLIAAPVGAQSHPALPAVDLSPLFDSIGAYFPYWFALLVIPSGISMALSLAKMIVTTVSSGFKNSSRA